MEQRKPEEIQREYYRASAAQYDAAHVHRCDEHYRALRYMVGFLGLYGIRSVLDVGCGTGRALKYLLDCRLTAYGVEPVPEMIHEAVHKNGIPKERVVRGKAEALPFQDDSFDAACEFGVLHHVRYPRAAVNEMTRVAKRAVFLSDSNRFGQGAWLARLAKLLIYRVGLWDIANYIKTGGKRYQFSAGDGLSYSYSVFDDLSLLAGWATTVILIPTMRADPVSWAHPILTSGHVLLCAFKGDQTDSGVMEALSAMRGQGVSQGTEADTQ
jgi:ubiquinone/menaquinone biosynthesis C-methylase UbiE